MGTNFQLNTRKIRINQRNWPAIVDILRKYAASHEHEITEKEKSIIYSVDERFCPACNPECDDFNERKIPLDFDTRVIAYLSTSPEFKDEDRSVVHQAIMSYGIEESNALEKLSVHVIKYIRRSFGKAYNKLKRHVEDLQFKMKTLGDDLKVKDEYSRKLLGEIAFLTNSIQNILLKSAGKVVQSEEKIIGAFEQNLSNHEIIELIKTQNRKFIHYLKEESKRASTDTLTGVFNRGTFDNHLKKTFMECRRSETPCSLLLVDIDHFKKINDTYGHLTGDEGIKLVVEAILEQIKSSSIFVARFGGEEFAIVLKGYDLKKAVSIAESIRINVESKLLATNRNQTGLKITVSIGATQINSTHAVPQDFFQSADEELYRAKNSGRNKVCAASYK